jgi:Helix-turn-helix domain
MSSGLQKSVGRSEGAMATQRDVVPIRPTTTTAITRTTPLSELPELLTVNEAASWLRVGRDAAYQLAANRGIRIGRYLRVPRRVIEEMVRGE